ncbi:hypothetical protein PMI09_00587 [Rhizobium sp. CF122]|nr:hypothetical protein PMI09_00587 [Rhizobium sp. CF122]
MSEPTVYSHNAARRISFRPTGLAHGERDRQALTRPETGLHQVKSRRDCRPSALAFRVYLICLAPCVDDGHEDFNLVVVQCEYRELCGGVPHNGKSEQTLLIGPCRAWSNATLCGLFA